MSLFLAICAGPRTTNDIPAHCLAVTDLPGIPDGYEVDRVEVVVRLQRKAL